MIADVVNCRNNNTAIRPTRSLQPFHCHNVRLPFYSAKLHDQSQRVTTVDDRTPIKRLIGTFVSDGSANAAVVDTTFSTSNLNYGHNDIHVFVIKRLARPRLKNNKRQNTILLSSMAPSAAEQRTTQHKRRPRGGWQKWPCNKSPTAPRTCFRHHST